MACSLIVGLGRSGVGAARLLHAQGHQVVVLERDSGPEQQSKAQQLSDQGIQTELGCPLEFSSFQPWLDQVEQVVISPGIPWDHPTLMQLRNHGVTKGFRRINLRLILKRGWDPLSRCKRAQSLTVHEGANKASTKISRP